MRPSFIDDRKQKRASREKVISGAEEFLQVRAFPDAPCLAPGISRLSVST
jgi:hypothetical protein